MSNRSKETSLICEALVREIYNAKRWSAVVEAWQALLHVREISKQMVVEEAYFGGHLQHENQAAPEEARGD